MLHLLLGNCYWHHKIHWICKFKEALSVLMLCAPVFIFTSSSSVLLGHPRCFYWFDSHYLPCSIHFSEFMLICFSRKRTKPENIIWKRPPAVIRCAKHYYWENFFNLMLWNKVFWAKLFSFDSPLVSRVHCHLSVFKSGLQIVSHWQTCFICWLSWTRHPHGNHVERCRCHGRCSTAHWSVFF